MPGGSMGMLRGGEAASLAYEASPAGEARGCPSRDPLSQGGPAFGYLSPLEDVKMGAGQPHEVPATMCKHHLRALLISRVRPWRHQLPTAGAEAGDTRQATCVISWRWQWQKTPGSRGQTGDHLLVPLSALQWPDCPAQHLLDAKPQQLLGQRGPELTQALPHPGPQSWPRARCRGLTRNTCVHGISCPGSAFISSSSKNPRRVKVKETSQSITQTTATRAAETGLSKLNFNSHPMARPRQPIYKMCHQLPRPGRCPARSWQELTSPLGQQTVPSTLVVGMRP